VILAFILASVVTMLNAFCFAEYASRTPKTGATYTFVYQTVGEAMAFIVGWTGIIGKGHNRWRCTDRLHNIHVRLTRGSNTKRIFKL